MQRRPGQQYPLGRYLVIKQRASFGLHLRSDLCVVPNILSKYVRTVVLEGLSRTL